MRSVLTQVANIAAEHQATIVSNVEVEIGPLSGVESLLLTSAWERLTPGSICSSATLTIKETGLHTLCRKCGVEFELPDFRFQCAECGSDAVQVTRGDEFRLMNVTLSGDSPTTETV